MSDNGTPQPLGYAPPARWYGRRRWRRVAALCVLIAVGVAGWRYGAAAVERATILYWQRQCLTFAPPAGNVAFESDPTGAATLLRQGKSRGYYPMGAEPRLDGSWARPPTAALYPECWNKFGDVTDPMGATSMTFGAILYLHERRTPEGTPVLVSIRLGVPTMGDGASIEPEVIEPAGWSKPARQLNWGASVGRVEWPDLMKRNRRLRVFSGQSDPAHAARFHIPFELDGKADTIVGEVIDEDGLLSFELESDRPRFDPP